MRTKFHRLSLIKYLFETVGPNGSGGFHILTNSQQVNFSFLADTYGGWVVFEIGTCDPKPKMDISVLITCCARGSDSESTMDDMKDSVRDAFAAGTIIPLYNTDTQESLGGFVVQGCLEGPVMEQVGGGFNSTFAIVLKVGIVI